MLEGRTFGIPKREVKVDPYVGQSLLIMHPAPAEAKKTFRFELTKLAVEQLGVQRENNTDEKLVSFSFGENDILIANTTGMKGTIDSNSQYNVSMTGNFSNKNAHDYITNILGLDPTQEYKFQVVLDTESELPVAKLEIMVADEEIESTDAVETEETPADQAPEETEPVDSINEDEEPPLVEFDNDLNV